MTLLSRDTHYQKEINEISINLNCTSKKIKALSHKADYYFFLSLNADKKAYLPTARLVTLTSIAALNAKNQTTQRVCISAAISLLGKRENVLRNTQASEEASKGTCYSSVCPQILPLCSLPPQILTNLFPCGLVNLLSSRHVQVNLKPHIKILAS